MLEALIVDDDFISLEVLKAMLSGLGVAVTGVQTGTLALEAIQSKSFDLIILDYDMPIMDGPQTCREIKALTEHPTIIGLTGHQDPNITQHCLQAGMLEVLTKPLDPPDLIALLERIGLSQPS